MTTDLTEFLSLKYTATDLLVFYSSHQRSLPHPVNGATKIARAYVEHHTVKGGKVLAGTPIQQKFIREFTAALQEAVTTSATVVNLMPSNVLFHDTRPGRHIVAWFEPAGKKTLLFAKPPRPPKGGFKEQYNISMPDLLYLANGDTLYVYAMNLKGQRPTLNTMLYDAPLCNIYGDGRVCMGDVKCPEQTEDIQELVTLWLRAFWTGKFTHAMATHINLVKLYNSLGNKKVFPFKILHKCSEKKTINELLKGL